MESFLLKPKDEKSFIERIQALKYSTRENYMASLHRFELFCRKNYEERTTEEIISELKSLPQENRDEAYFGVLQDFVNWLMKLGLANSTVNLYCQIVTYYFNYMGIRTHQIELRQNVKKPKKINEKLHPLTKEEILQIYSITNEKRRMLYLTLIGSGMRIRECMSLRKKDFDLDCVRIKIEVPAQFTKTQRTHCTFVSNEAEKYLRPHLESLSSESLVFTTNKNPYHASMTEIEAFSRTRDRAGLTGKYQSTNRHFISLHSFRSYFFTRARRVLDSEVAHAMIGHTAYLDMYDRKDENERLELYLKVEPEINILN